MNRICLACLIAAYIFGSGVGIAADDLLSDLRVAQQFNLGRYPEGELRAVLRQGSSGGEFATQHLWSEVQIRWSNDKVRAMVRRWGLDGREQRPELPPTEQIEWLIADGKAVMHSLDNGFVGVIPPASIEPTGETRLTPNPSWFGSFGGGPFGGEMTWLKLLDPRLLTGADPSKISLQVVAREDGLVEVLRADDSLKSRESLVFSLPLDGNLIKYHQEFRGEVMERTDSGEFLWERDARKRVILKRSNESREIKHKALGQASIYRDAEIVEFDPDQRPSPQLFRVDLFKTTARRLAEKTSTGLRTRNGDRPQPAATRRLDDLGAILRSRGFAAAHRGR